MAVKITYFVHGTTTDNENGFATGWLPGELSQIGIQQTHTLKERINDIVFDAVFTSDLQRAIDSATICFGDRLEIAQDARLRECNYGDWNGQPAIRFKDVMEQYVDTPFPHGESYKDVERRIALFLKDLRQECDGKHIAIVAHQAPQLALDVLLKGLTWQEAIDSDWRKSKAWQPGWEYTL